MSNNCHDLTVGVYHVLKPHLYLKSTYYACLHIICATCMYMVYYVLIAGVIDGRWSAWVKGACSITCGADGMREDTRTCANPPPRNGGRVCNGPAKRSIPCFTCPCKKLYIKLLCNQCRLHKVLRNCKWILYSCALFTWPCDGCTIMRQKTIKRCFKIVRMLELRKIHRNKENFLQSVA